MGASRSKAKIAAAKANGAKGGAATVHAGRPRARAKNGARGARDYPPVPTTRGGGGR
jgi:hypothetical protein